ncbi:MAG TPA: peptidase S8/S53 subtilisin kexin sedolisin [Clostridiales bacterium]|nr:peptidase S8/S53 subtilisin kexin sedolisin [Clostridiales bacterium]
MNCSKNSHPVKLLIWLISVFLLFALPVQVAAMPMAAEKVDVMVAFHQQPGASEMALIRSAGGSIRHTYSIIPAIAASLPATAVAAMQKNPAVARIERDVQIFALEDSYPWGIRQVGADSVHSTYNNKGAGVKIAIIDTGVDYNHPDLAGRYAGGYDFVNNDSNPMDDNNHGTHVAGTIAAVINEAGIVGVAPEVSVYALKVLNRRGSGNFSDVIAALDWCVENGIQVTNNSFGSSTDPGISVQLAYDNAYNAGVLHVASAGNSGTSDGTGNTVGFPAQYESVIAVAATDSLNQRASFSSTGPAVELAAPGSNIYSTIRNGSYATYSGTSMASPHVAGTAALVIASGISGPASIRSQLQATADDLGSTGRDNWYGYGLVDADEAAGVVLPPADDPPVVNITEPLNNSTVKGTVLISAEIVEGTNPVSSVEFMIDGDPVCTDTYGADGWSAYWDTTVYTEGSHTIGVTATDSAGLSDTDNIMVIVDNLLNQSIETAGLAGSSEKVNPVTWRATVIVTVGPVCEGASVYGSWSNGTSGIALTDSNGQCTFVTGNINKKINSITFTVNNITWEEYEFKPGNDSIMVDKP